MDFADALKSVADRVETTLDDILQPAGRAPGEERIVAAMRHAVMGGGKRLRAFLTVEGAGLFGVEGAPAFRAAAAVECLHAYSLVHDDLPCMDDDDLRRGKPTVHIAFDEATAVLAGDALQTLAFEIVTDPATHDDTTVRADLALGLAQASGVAGMVGGQCIDIAAESADAPFDLVTVTRLQALKTGALIRYAAEAGAILGQDAAGRDALGRYAAHLGLAFQIADDILDVTGDEAAAGKRLQKDDAAGKATFVSLLGLEGARTTAETEIDRAVEALAPFGPAADRLRDAARFTIARRT